MLNMSGLPSTVPSLCSAFRENVNVKVTTGDISDLDEFDGNKCDLATNLPEKGKYYVMSEVRILHRSLFKQLIMIHLAESGCH